MSALVNDINLVSVDLTQENADPITNWYPNYYQTWWPQYVPPANFYTYVNWPIPTPRCAWCQGQHVGKCERLKSVTYREDGTVQRVEFFEEEGEHHR